MTSKLNGALIWTPPERNDKEALESMPATCASLRAAEHMIASPERQPAARLLASPAAMTRHASDSSTLLSIRRIGVRHCQVPCAVAFPAFRDALGFRAPEETNG